MDEHPEKTSLLEKISSVLSREPETRAELIDMIRNAYERHLIDADALSMTEGALQVSEMDVHEVMIPRANVSMLDINAPFDDIFKKVVEDGHSRFPVYEENRDNVIGILLAKDLLRTVNNTSVSLRSLLRPPIFIPQAKRLNVLLRDFRMNRNHMAIVVDEYGSVAGLITIEDVLEQIVGDIQDEFDYNDCPEDWIVRWPDNRHRVAAKIPLAVFNDFFHTHFSSDKSTTLGDYLMEHFHHLPKRGEEITIDKWNFEVIRSDLRGLQTVLVENPEEETM